MCIRDRALRDNDMNYILSQAIEQIDAGADILDVNVGSPDIDEKEMMVKVIKALQAIVDVPLQIDSTKPEVLEAALRVYNCLLYTSKRKKEKRKKKKSV